MSNENLPKVDRVTRVIKNEESKIRCTVMLLDGFIKLAQGEDLNELRIHARAARQFMENNLDGRE